MENLAINIGDRFIMYNAEECHLTESASAPGDILNYACCLMNMVLLARNLQDSYHEGDGGTI